MTVLSVDFEDFEGFVGNEGPTRIVADIVADIVGNMVPVCAHAVREDSGTWMGAEKERFGS